MTDFNIADDLTRWFEHGDELAHRRAYEELASRLYPPPEVVKALGQAATDEIRQEVLLRLLDREKGALSGVEYPVAYARTTWKRALASVVRKWKPRRSKEGEVRDHLSNLAVRDDAAAAECRIDAERAVEIADTLSGKGRLAILLTTRPDRITGDEWQRLVVSLPPPPPPKPMNAIDREEASRLLYPPPAVENERQAKQRLNSFDKAWKRAVDSIREGLGGNQ